MKKCIFKNGICLCSEECKQLSPERCVFFLSEEVVARLLALSVEMYSHVKKEEQELVPRDAVSC
jgi:hypothetical protein